MRRRETAKLLINPMKGVPLGDARSRFYIVQCRNHVGGGQTIFSAGSTATSKASQLIVSPPERPTFCYLSSRNAIT